MSSNSSDEAKATFDWTAQECPSAAVVEAVSGAAGVAPTELDPLYATLDPDALDAVFTRTGLENRPSEARVEFPFAGHHVVVKANGRGYVYDRTEPVPVAGTLDVDAPNSDG